MDTIGFRVKCIRKDLQLTQNQFAAKLFISQSYLSGIEKDTVPITDKLKKILCYEFGINETWLENGEGEMYDDVCENDIEDYYYKTNELIVGIMKLLHTESMSELGHILYVFEAVRSIIADARIRSEDRIQYLEQLEVYFGNLNRVVNIQSHLLQNITTSNILVGIDKNVEATKIEFEKLIDILKNNI